MRINEELRVAYVN